uniref:Putative secreted protein n=1 Tax=Ixodes ricinus TaxID=34613 RepID=A0A6B0UDV3_IXORI
MHNLLVVVLLDAVNLLHLHVGLSVEGVLLEVDVLEVGVHVESGRPKVVRPRDVWNDALPALAHVWQAHPHVPVPELFRGGPAWLELVLVEASLQDPAQARHGLHPV